jgi:hypothetical protein
VKTLTPTERALQRTEIQLRASKAQCKQLKQQLESAKAQTRHWRGIVDMLCKRFGVERHEDIKRHD